MYYCKSTRIYESASGGRCQLVPSASDTPEAISFDNFEAIDADSSRHPLPRVLYHRMSQSLAERNLRRIGKCDPRTRRAGLTASTRGNRRDLTQARAAILGQKNRLRRRPDRRDPDDGRGYVWHQLNDAGKSL